MVAEKALHRLMLRAELQHGSARIITHTIEISDRLAFVQTDESAFIGDPVMVKFSFPGLVEPFLLEAQVIARKAAGGPGRPAGWTLGFMFYRSEEQARLRTLLARVHSAHDEPGSYQYRVLFVEDNLLTREAVELGASKLLNPADMIALDTVASGEHAFDKLMNESYDLAIVDYFLPMLSGGQLIAKLRRQPDLAGLPIFAMSIGGADVRKEALAAGADLFLQKPLVLRDLLGTLKQLMGVRERDHHGAHLTQPG